MRSIQGLRRRLAGAALVGLGLFGIATLSGCGGGGGAAGAGASTGGQARLVAVHYGRLVDVFGLRKTASGTTVVLYRTDVMIGPDIQDERTGQQQKGDEEILYDFISSNPENLQPRLLITRVIGTREFQEAFDALDAKLRRVTPGVFGQNTAARPFTVVPRNAALRLTFSKPLGIDEGFFVERDAQGRVVGLKNAEAVQLLEIVGDPRDQQPAGDFKVIASRLAFEKGPDGKPTRPHQLIVDPVLLGNEGLQYQTRNNAAGLPAAPDQTGANIRLAIALEGPLAIPGIRADRVGELNGLNNDGRRSVIRDFRSGNDKDDSADIRRGFVRDPIPPRILGEIVFYLEKIEQLNDDSLVLTLYKNGVKHEVDRGDVIRVVKDNSGVPVTFTEVTVEPEDDRAKPEVQHVRVVVRRTRGLERLGEEGWYDPLVKLAARGYPANVKQREKWLVQNFNAPKCVLITEFTAERVDPVTKKVYGDDPRYFLTFSPSPLPFADGTPSPANENISPFAGAIVRFTKPVDLATVKALDTYFFGTRNLLDKDEVDRFIADRRIDPKSFRQAKFMTPHLVFAKVFDEDGSQTALRLQPTMGFYLDERMRKADEGKPFKDKKYKYYVHLLGGKDGIKDLSGNPIDFQSQVSVRDSLVIPFSLDTRKSVSGGPAFPDNLVVTVARRYADRDEDEQPSYYIDDEIQQKGSSQLNPLAFNLQDVFGGVVYLFGGRLSARPTTRVTKVVDDLNQQPPPPQTSPLRWCPERIGSEPQVVTATATVKFGQPIQNPLNPFGARLQTVWREIDMSLSRTDPFDFNLDVEQMYWAPFAGAPITYDEFDRLSLFLGHSERRPEPCVGAQGSLPTMASSGLIPQFDENYVNNLDTKGSRESRPLPHKAFADANLLIDANLAITEPNGVHRYLPLPEFQKPYFVWRDERVLEQGGNSERGWDTATSRGGNFDPYIVSPFLTGRGRYVTRSQLGLKFNSGAWDNRRNYWINQTARQDLLTGGLVGSIALPLLADFWVYPDSEELPKDNPFLAAGSNGWQIALAVQSAPTPNFRVYSAGGLVQGKPERMDPTQSGWATAVGGFTPTGQRTRCCDNSVYWVMADFRKRISVATAGFVDILDPHRVDPKVSDDPRLGPFFGMNMPNDVLPRFEVAFEPPLETLPGGTSVIAEFRGAGIVDPEPWAAKQNNYQPPPNPKNFPLDPLKAGDAHIRKYDDRPVNGQARNFWTYYYNRNVTTYVNNPNKLMDAAFTSQFAGPNEAFLPRDVRYFNWRFILKNNVDANPPVSPTIESFAVTYRFEKVR